MARDIFGFNGNTNAAQNEGRDVPVVTLRAFSLISCAGNTEEEEPPPVCLSLRLVARVRPMPISNVVLSSRMRPI